VKRGPGAVAVAVSFGVAVTGGVGSPGAPVPHAARRSDVASAAASVEIDVEYCRMSFIAGLRAPFRVA
jgi:hypothetical protein